MVVWLDCIHRTHQWASKTPFHLFSKQFSTAHHLGQQWVTVQAAHRWAVMCRDSCTAIITTTISERFGFTQQTFWINSFRSLRKRTFPNISKYSILVQILLNYSFGKHHLFLQSSLTVPLGVLISDKRQVHFFLLFRLWYNGSMGSPLGDVGHTHCNRGSGTLKACL